MSVIDTKSSSTAVGLIALQAAKLSRAGKDHGTIIGQVKELADHVEHIFMVQDLNWLVRGGRLIRAEGLAGKILNVKPILHVRDGAVELLEKSRGRKKALFTIVDILEERISNFPEQTIGISHSDDKDTANELAAIITQRLGVRDIMINQIGATLTSHLGVGGVGVFFFNKKPELYIK
jgi:DegV family protein with EDD domain